MACGRSEAQVRVHRNPHGRRLKHDGVVSPSASRFGCGPSKCGTDAAPTGTREGPDVVDATGVSATNCDCSADRPSVQPSDKESNVWVGRERCRDQSVRQFSGEPTFFKDVDELIQTRLGDRDDGYARAQCGPTRGSVRY